MTALQTLIAAKALINTPDKWCKGKFGMDDVGQSIDPMRACRRCAIGAVTAACNGERWSDGFRYAREYLWKAKPRPELHLTGYNDLPSTTHADIMALFDRAIDAAGR